MLKEDLKLTDRETEVVRLLCKGFSNVEIAGKLFVTSHTVKAHVASIIQKFNVKNRTELAYIIAKNYAKELGLE